MKVTRGLYYALPISLAMWGMLLIGGFKAFGQEQATPRERAFMERINIEISNNLGCSTNSIALQDRIKQLEQKLTEAEKKVPPVSAN